MQARSDMSAPVVYQSRAPQRITFSGGGTDVNPYPLERGGCVLSSTIDKFAWAALVPRPDREVHVTSLDYDLAGCYHLDDLVCDGQLDLAKATLKRLGIQQGLDLWLHSDVPPGSGLGASSALVVAIIGAVASWQELPLTRYDIAALAYRIEREDLRFFGGLQDQYAATFGGFNFIEFLRDSVVVQALPIPISYLRELRRGLILCYTGQTRHSGPIVSVQTQAYIERRSEAVAALDEIKDQTFQLRQALLAGQFEEFGRLLHAGWESKKRLNSQISNERIDRLYEAARRHGALGGHIQGGGGGGYLILYGNSGKQEELIEGLEKLGGEISHFEFETAGMQAWCHRHG